jgi:hypothetical protein
MLGFVEVLRFLPADDVGHLVSIGMLGVLVLFAGGTPRWLRRVTAVHRQVDGRLHDYGADIGAALIPSGHSIRLDEGSARRFDFVDGVTVRLADGDWWSLPLRDTRKPEPEYDELLAAVCEAEDREERLLGELALMVSLLDRNYNLAPNELAELLNFSQGDPALAELQYTVHSLVIESVRRLRRRAALEGEGSLPAEYVRATPFRSSAIGSLRVP